MYRGEIAPTEEVQYAFGFRKWVRVEMPSNIVIPLFAKDTKRCMQASFSRLS